MDAYGPTSEEGSIMPFFDCAGRRFNLAAHASINGLCEYVGQVGPKYVATGHSKSQPAKQLAELIERHCKGAKVSYEPVGYVHRA